MFRKLSLLSAVIALIVIAIGAYIKLSHAGLGCEDWPACYGKNMVQSLGETSDQTQTGDSGLVQIEQGHRYLATGLLGLMVLLFGFAWRESRRTLAVVLSLIALSLGVAQAGLGIVAINWQFMPVIVTAHLLLGFATFWALSWCYLRLNSNLLVQARASKLAWFSVLAMLVLIAEIILGAWVSSNYAGLACTDFPRCNGVWIPDADYRIALDFLHGLVTGDISVLPEAERAFLHGLHRVFAVITFVLLSAVMLSATDETLPKPVRRSGSVLSLLLLLEILLGVLSVKHSLPIGTVLAHQLLAACLMLPLLGIYIFSKYAPSVDEVVLPELTEQPELKPQVDAGSLYQRLSSQLKKTRSSLGGVLSQLALSQDKVSRDLLTEIETSLLMADIGIETTTAIIKNLTTSLENDQLRDGEALSQALKQQLFEMLAPCSQPLIIPKQDQPYVILVVGVNGAGKTTSIGKLAHRLQDQGHSVMLAAGDTFRAAAVEQLQTWGERNNVHVVAQHTGADSASVIFDALQSAKAKGVDVLIADTAGRLHTKSNLMDELKKIKRIMGKLDESAPHEVLLILDACTGQNALSQARIFNEAVQLTGLALTKLDGTAKGGVIFALANQLQIPIRFIGVGEGINDLQDFDARSFVDALFLKD